MKVGDLVEARHKGWLGVDYGIIARIDNEDIFVFWFKSQKAERRHNKEELILMEEK